jgi:hypothetical protein
MGIHSHGKGFFKKKWKEKEKENLWFGIRSYKSKGSCFSFKVISNKLLDLLHCFCLFKKLFSGLQ